MNTYTNIHTIYCAVGHRHIDVGWAIRNYNYVWTNWKLVNQRIFCQNVCVCICECLCYLIIYSSFNLPGYNFVWSHKQCLLFSHFAMEIVWQNKYNANEVSLEARIMFNATFFGAFAVFASENEVRKKIKTNIYLRTIFGNWSRCLSFYFTNRFIVAMNKQSTIPIKKIYSFYIYSHQALHKYSTYAASKEFLCTSVVYFTKSIDWMKKGDSININFNNK